jgi:putative ABC transport system permease protein
MPGSKPLELDATPPMMAPLLAEEFPEVETAARLSPSFFPPNVRRGDVKAAESAFFWADPDVFRVLPLPTVAGRLDSALERPDGVVLTRSMARKYFGKDAPISGARLPGSSMISTAAAIWRAPCQSFPNDEKSNILFERAQSAL